MKAASPVLTKPVSAAWMGTATAAQGPSVLLYAHPCLGCPGATRWLPHRLDSAQKAKGRPLARHRGCPSPPSSWRCCSKIRTGFSKKWVQPGQTRRLHKAKLSMPPSLAADHRAAPHPPLCSAPHAPSAPLFCLWARTKRRGAAKRDGVLRQGAAGWGVGGTKGPQRITARPCTKAYACISLQNQRSACKTSEPFCLSRPRGSRGLGQHHPGRLPVPPFLAQRNPVPEGNVCVSIQTLVVWTFPFTARVSRHLLYTVTRVCEPARSMCREQRVPTSAGEEPAGRLCLALAKPARGIWSRRCVCRALQAPFLNPFPPHATSKELLRHRRARCRVKSARHMQNSSETSCLDRKDLQDHRVHLLARDVAALIPEIPQTRGTCIPPTRLDYPTTRAAPASQPRSDSRKDDTWREGGQAPNFSRCSRN